MRPLLLVLVALVVLTPAAAHADVLVHYPRRVIDCGDDIKVGVWYQAYSGGPRWARIHIKSARGYILAKKKVRATKRWRYWYYAPRCGRTYYVRYIVPGGSLTAKVRVRP